MSKVDHENQSGGGGTEADAIANQERLRQMALDMALLTGYGNPEAMGVALFYLLKANQGEAEQQKKEDKNNA